jgi:hypothetical protein
MTEGDGAANLRFLFADDLVPSALTHHFFLQLPGAVHLFDPGTEVVLLQRHERSMHGHIRWRRTNRTSVLHNQRVRCAICSPRTQCAPACRNRRAIYASWSTQADKPSACRRDTLEEPEPYPPGAFLRAVNAATQPRIHRSCASIVPLVQSSLFSQQQ